MEKTAKKSKSKYVAAGVAVAVAISVIAFFAVNNSGTQPAPATQQSGLTTIQSAPVSATTGGLQVGDTFPDFSLVDPQKGAVTRQTFEGKPVVVYFFAAWCTSCQVGAQEIAKYYDETGKAFNVLMVDVDPQESNSQLVSFQQEFGRPGWYISSGPDMAQKDNVKYLDTKYVLDKNGIIRWEGLASDYATMKSVLSQLCGVC
jgi:cytochrome oxidase Cu insertion factor (SCO1/SenC/PrrC family)